MNTLLKKAIAFENMKRAWESVARNKGVPGVDRITVKKWRRKWEERIINLANDVRLNTYQPDSLRRIFIPKSGFREYRKIFIPTITDRVLQRAVLQVLYPIFEPEFLDCSFGYRPGRSLQQAVQRILDIRTVYSWVLDADIDDFFNQVPHQVLLGLLKRKLPDLSLLQIFQRWLRGDKKTTLERGIPMGAPISPLFANIVLHELDMEVIGYGFPMIRYADDFIVCAKNKQDIVDIYHMVDSTLKCLGLEFEPNKTSITSFKKGIEFLGVYFTEKTYSYGWKNRMIASNKNKVDFLFSRYRPEY